MQETKIENNNEKEKWMSGSNVYFYMWMRYMCTVYTRKSTFNMMHCEERSLF